MKTFLILLLLTSPLAALENAKTTHAVAVKNAERIEKEHQAYLLEVKEKAWKSVVHIIATASKNGQTFGIILIDHDYIKEFTKKLIFQDYMVSIEDEDLDGTGFTNIRISWEKP